MSAQFAAYPNYRDSGASWLGNVPEHWRPLRFKYAFSEKKKTVNPSLPPGSISFGNVVYKEIDNLSSDTLASYQEVLQGEILVNPLNMNYDLISLRTALSEIDVVVSTGYIVLRSSDLLNKRYVKWLLHQFDVAHMKTLGAGVRQTVSFVDIGNCFFFQPTRSEQEKIAKFLDHEIAKIDTLIEKQQQLIELLNEKRQAVITQAATKGIEAETTLKDSGINWMGTVPAHWKILPVKRLFDVSYGLMGEIDRSLESGVKVISLPNVLKNGTLDLSETSFRILTAEERRSSALKKGDLLFNWRNGSIDHVGKTALFNHDGDYAHVSFLLKLRALSCEVVPEFYWLALNGLRASGFFGSSKLQVNVTYNQSELRRVPLPVPPADEQWRIVNVVLKRYKAIDTAVERVNRGLELLQERRSALISAAVTGKIDIRDWQQPESSEKEVA